MTPLTAPTNPQLFPVPVPAPRDPGVRTERAESATDAPDRSFGERLDDRIAPREQQTPADAEPVRDETPAESEASGGETPESAGQIAPQTVGDQSQKPDVATGGGSTEANVDPRLQSADLQVSVRATDDLNVSKAGAGTLPREVGTFAKADVMKPAIDPSLIADPAPAPDDSPQPSTKPYKPGNANNAVSVPMEEVPEQPIASKEPNTKKRPIEDIEPVAKPAPPRTEQAQVVTEVREVIPQQRDANLHSAARIESSGSVSEVESTTSGTLDQHTDQAEGDGAEPRDPRSSREVRTPYAEPSKAPPTEASVSERPAPQVERAPAPQISTPEPALSAPKIAEPSTTARTPTLATTPTPDGSDTPPVEAQVSRGIGAVLRQRGGSIMLKLAPQSLGAVKIAMKMDQGTVSLDVEATTEAAHRALTKELGALRTTLESKGLRVERANVHLAPPSQTSGPAPSDASARQDGAGRDGHHHDDHEDGAQDRQRDQRGDRPRDDGRAFERFAQDAQWGEGLFEIGINARA